MALLNPQCLIQQFLAALLVPSPGGHVGGGELRVAPTRIVQREGGDVELALGEGAPLLLGLKQQFARVDLDFQPDVGLFHCA